jgi:hypothetical protein
MGEIMPRYLTEEDKKQWTFSKTLSTTQNVAALLTKMAIYRQANIDKVTLKLFTEYLEPLDLRAFQVAMAMISTSERQEGETSFPSLGTILAAMDEARELSPMYSKGATEINSKPIFADPIQKRLGK